MPYKNVIIMFSVALFILFSGILYFTTSRFDAHQEIDSEEYELVAQTYVATGQLVHPQHGMPVHPIGYYWLLGIVYWVFGNNQAWVFWIQCLLSLFCFWMLYKYTALLFEIPVAVVAVVLACCNIGFLVFSQLILAEILLTCCLLGFLYTFMLFMYRQKLLFNSTSALLLGASVLIKPVMLFYGVIAAFFVCFSKIGTYKIKIKHCLLFLFIFYFPVVSYMVYNNYMFNTFAVTTLHAGNLLDYFLPRRILPRLEMQERHTVEKFLAQSKDQHDHKQRSVQVFIDLLKKHPLLYCAATLEGIIKIFFGLYSTQLKIMYNTSLRGGSFSFFSMEGKTCIERLYNYTQYGTSSMILKIISLAELLWVFMVYLLLCYVFIILMHQRNYFLIFFWGSYIGYIVCAAAFEGCGRYRMMFEPLLLILAAVGIVELFRLLSIKKRINSFNRIFRFSKIS